MTIDRNFIELDIGNTELIVGSPRINRTGIKPELFIATKGDQQ